MLRKTITCLLVVTFMFSSLVSAQAVTDMTLLEKTVAIEKIYYGAEQTGSLLDRAAKLEKEVYGTETRDAIMAKMDRLYTYTKENSVIAPSFLIKLNAVEWALTHSVKSQQPAKARIENLEHILMGNTANGSFDDRLKKLMQLAYTGGQLDITSTALTKDTLIKVKMVTPLSTKTNRVGDIVVVQAAQDVYVGDTLVIAQGAQGLGKITKIEQRKNFGRDAQMEISFDTIDAIDGTTVVTFLGDKAKEESKSLAMAAGATVAGLAILGPVGVVGGAFVHGKDVNIPADSQLFVQVKADQEVYGIQGKEEHK